ncbi:MAG: RidA family protein [Actinomycetota bacterium]
MANKEAFRFGNFMEEVYGFAQAVKAGDTIYVSGQTAFQTDGSIAGTGDMAEQMRAAYRNIEKVLREFGATMDDIVEETLYVTDIMGAAGAAHDVRGEFYGERYDVASTLIGVAALGLPDLLIEIRCTARV